jgi:hypothetical protein
MPSSNQKHVDRNAGVIESEAERLRRDIFRPDMEKFKLFTQMLRTNALYKKAKITHQ